MFSALFTAFVAVVLLLVPLALGGPVVARNEQRSGRDTVVVTGVTEGGIHVRRNIADLNDDEISLLMLGFRRLQRADQNDPLSFYQLAGIHGQPYVPWGGVDPVKGGEQTGYCVHRSQLFPTWHRPYLALIEQVLYGAIQAEVRNFEGSEREKLLRVARSFRLPYFDWASRHREERSVLPRVLATPRISIRTPQGVEEIANPLYRYRFHPLDPEKVKHKWPFTVRYATRESDPSRARSQNRIAARELDKNLPNIRQQMYTVLTSDRDYAEFTVPTWMNGNTGSTSTLEVVHGEIHGLVGGGGTMNDFMLSAFDPIFIFIHVNADRFLAMWQHLHPDRYVTPAPTHEGSFTINRGTVVDKDTELKPFYSNSDGEFWTSEKVRKTETFAYTYPELVNRPSNEAVRDRINELYGPSRISSNADRPATPNRDRSRQRLQSRAEESNTFHQYEVDIKAPQSDSFSVYVFVGQVNNEPDSWSLEDSLAGIHFIIASRMAGDLEIAGTVSLTDLLEKKVQDGELASMKPDDVVPYLKKHLQWRVKSMDGSSVDAEKVPGLLVSVSHVALRLPSSKTEFPQPEGDYEVYPEASAGKPCGAEHEHDF